MFTQDKVAKAAIEDRILKDFSDSRYAAAIAGTRRRTEAIGKPFELEFTEAINGSPITMKDFKGKVVVIDFWATWCGPCVAEMPHMKEIYAQYHDRGVEFIGISLDQPKEDGGLDSLKKYVKEEKIPWPQYYQGNGWESKFSRSWGINSIPAMFVVAPDGTLYSVEARETRQHYFRTAEEENRGWWNARRRRPLIHRLRLTSNRRQEPWPQGWGFSSSGR